MQPLRNPSSVLPARNVPHRKANAMVLSRVCFLLLLLVGLVGCIPGELLRQARQPRIEPVRAGSGGSGSGVMEIRASTNCAEVGESVVFTITIVNQSTGSMTIMGSPVFDIVLQPNKWTRADQPIVQRWSQSDQYPATIHAILSPNDVRTYEWVWTADPVYSPPNSFGVIATLEIGQTEYANGAVVPAGSIQTAVGVGTMPGGESPTGILCKNMQRP